MVIDTLVNNLVSNFFGEVWILGLVLVLFLIIGSISIGLNFSSSIIISLPIFMMIATSGFLSGKGWISDAILVVAGIAYGFIMVRLLGR